MSDQLTLSAETRDRAGKGASRDLRRQNRIPAVIYGNKQDPELIHVEEKALVKLVDDRPLFEQRGRDRPWWQKADHHAKGRCFSSGERSPDPCRLPAHRQGREGRGSGSGVFINEEKSPGLKRGGVLNVVRHELELICENDKMPDDIRLMSPASTSAIRSTSAM